MQTISDVLNLLFYNSIWGLVLITHLTADGQVLVWTQDVHDCSLKLTEIYQKVECSGELDPGYSESLTS